ncbi:snoaL-like polyketide cyclase family protein [Mycobacterium kansasii 732]|uniref:SnoaL-like polyketide cyclase family protein n=1 Tax=Mycobacterium kansasii 662 TaxID=1299326 RepID=X7YZJ4_MYCKA|nr:ester cyclase [Mycobacterium kansasii]EUA06084.1 snoaL-like polyketide cyclase family protein [Mycobacterium kansasii 732]EUA12622.1 snoaL-like polyketide cyclase family protein [Mycobacterium kansasii 662]
MTALQPGITNAEWVREVFRRIFDERDFSHAQDFWSDDSVDYFLATGETVRGAAALTQWFTGLFAAVPDWRLVIENVVDDGTGQVVVQWKGCGSFTGSPFQGIEATGRRVEILGCDVIRLAPDGRVASNTVYYDGAGFARQIGMLPMMGTRADRLVTRGFNAITKLRRRVGR